MIGDCGCLALIVFRLRTLDALDGIMFTERVAPGYHMGGRDAETPPGY
jgi:hypothetical protein